jgi:FkbM family methyltransferase
LQQQQCLISQKPIGDIELGQKLCIDKIIVETGLNKPKIIARKFVADYADKPKSYGTLTSAREFLTKNKEARDEIIACLLRLEKKYQPGTDQNLREVLSGPIVDMLVDENSVHTRQVSNGLKFNFRYSSRIAREFLMAQPAIPDHVWEPQTTRSVVALSEGGSNVIIGGAYFGDHALFVAKAVGKGGVCHCFELSSENIAVLKRNLADNEITNVVVNAEALWSIDDVRIELGGDDSHATPKLGQGGDAVTYASRSIDTYVHTNKLDRIDVIMLDIEGGEFAALQGARKVLAQSADKAPALICEIHSAYTDWSRGLRHTTLCALMIENGYEVFAIRDYQANEAMAGHKVELVDIDSAVISGPPHGFNLLAVKDRNRLDPKVFEIVKGVSPKLLHHRDQKIYGPLN